MVRVGADRCEVKMLVDGKTIRRSRGKSGGSYSLGKKEYKAMGGDVPEPIVGLLNLTEANWQGQHDPPFWFSLTPGEVARQLNKIVDLELIDDVASRLGGLARVLRAEQDVVDKRLGEVKERLETYATAPRIDEQLNGLEETGNGLVDLTDRADRLDGFLVAAERVSDEWKELDRKFVDASLVIAFGNDWKKLRQRIVGLQELVQGIEVVEKVLSTEAPDTSGLKRLYDGVRLGGERIERLGSLLEHAREVSSDVGDLTVELKKAEGSLREETEGRCPLCGGVLK
jgi:DNA repair exonuclease SbcCD ATPase subunit